MLVGGPWVGLARLMVLGKSEGLRRGWAHRDWRVALETIEVRYRQRRGWRRFQMTGRDIDGE